MVDVVAVHGMALGRTHRSEMAELWHAALVEGLKDERSPHADTLTVECAFYSHRYHDGKDDAEEAYTGADLEAGFETKLVLAVGDALPDDAPTNGKPYLPSSVQSALGRVQAAELFRGLDGMFISFVKQVKRYLHDEEFAAAVRQEVGRAMAAEPRVVIGHSLGSVVAYDWLRRNPVSRPTALVTLGSPLGLEAVRRRLLGHRLWDAWPGGVTSWTNVAAREDAVAMVKELGPLYHVQVVDRLCRNPRLSAHSVRHYLSNVWTASAVIEALEKEPA